MEVRWLLAALVAVLVVLKAGRAGAFWVVVAGLAYTAVRSCNTPRAAASGAAVRSPRRLPQEEGRRGACARR